jgi:hypothetical protein
LPGALEVFRQLSQEYPAAWLYGACQLVDAAGRCLYQFNHQLNSNCLTPVLAGEWVPLQASLIQASAFFSAGGFDSLSPNMEDKDLLARMALEHDFYGTAVPVAAILRGIWASTTDYRSVPANIHRAREPILDQPRSFPRLRASASNSYWQGRLLRIFLISILWNARRWRVLKAANRCAQAFACLFLAGPHLLSGDYWHALVRQHLTRGFTPAPADTTASQSHPPPDTALAHAGAAREGSPGA